MIRSKWPTRSVAELQDKGILLVEDGNHGEYRPRNDEFGEGEYAFIRAANMDDGKVLFESAQLINDAAVARIRKGIGRNGDVLFSHKGTVGKLALVPLDAPPFVCSPQTTFWRTLDEERLDRRYLYLFMRSRAFADQWMARSNETDMAAYVGLTAQRQLSVALPEIEVQRAIAGVLGTLDDKIEQNRRTTRALERLARAIFRAWFVDFEPVKAKAEGATSFPSMPQHVFDALPTRLVDSGIGPVPVGWTPKSLYETAIFVNGAAFREEHFCKPSDGLPVVKIAELKNGITEQTRFSNRQDLDLRYRIDTGEMLYSWSGNPDTSIDIFLWTKGPGLLNQHIFRVVTRSNAHRYIIYYILKHLRPTLVEIARDKQTTGLGHVTVADMRRLLVCWPTQDVLDGFERQGGPVFEASFALMMENERLAETRDYLLPRLLSRSVHVETANG